MGPASDIEAWLEELELGRYAALFSEHEIDLSILPDLSNEDLVEIGLPLGPRRKIQRALVTLNQPVTVSRPVEDAERRHLTVMFADMVGSSAMSTKMDPEELRELMRAYQDMCKAAVDRFEGFIARFMGDGMLAYFGYPRAHENDAERSVRSGLELLKLTAALNARLDAVDLQVRVGIATGPVVVGDLIGEGASSERQVVGETPNIAARIESAAPPGHVVVGLDTFKLLGDRFETEEMPLLTIKGYPEPIRVFRIISERQMMTRFKAARGDSGAIFVGRTMELATLRDCWAATCASKGNACLITGEAGVGKSRFLEEFLERIQNSNPAIIQFQCSPFHSNTAFHPIIEWMTALAKFKENDTREVRRQRLDRLVHEAPRSRAESVQLIATLLNVDIGEELPPRLRDNPALRLVAIHEMLIEQILARTDQGSVTVVFEDAHWIDPTTLEFARQISRACKNRRLLVLATSRPDVTIEHVLRRSMRSINLSGLSRKETEELIRSVPQGRSLPALALNAVVERTDGIPLFVEELTKLVLERADEFAYSESNIPTTLVDSLTERLDRLGSSKGVAQIGATIGREFSYEILRRIDPRDETALEHDIKRLVDAELLQPVESKDERAYRFKHALVQDAAYGTLLYSTRREHHSQIADVMLEVFPDTAQSKPEILAHHLNEGGRALEAVDYWKAAGLNATTRSANAEAVRLLSLGIEALNSLPSRSTHLLKKELELQIALGPPLVAARGYASSELEAAFSRALEIDDQLSEGITDFHALWGLSSFYLIRGQLQQSRDLLTVCLDLAEREGKEDWMVLVSSWLGAVFFYSNDFERAEELLRKAIRNYQPESAAQLGFQFGLDPAVLARVHLVWLHWLRGENDKAHELDTDTLAFSEALDHPLSHVHALNFSVVLQVFLGNYDKALERAERVLSVSGEFEFPHYLAYARIMHGYAVAKLGSVNQGIDEMVKGLKARSETGAELVRPMFLTMLAEVLLDAGQLSWGIETLDEVDSIIALNGESWLEAESKRVRGMALEQQNPDNQEARICLRSALEAAQASGSKSLEIRVLVSTIKLQDRCKNQDSQSPELLKRLATLVEGLPEEIPSIDRQQSYELLAAHGLS